MKFLKREKISENIDVDSVVQNTVLSLNKRFPQLEEVTNIYTEKVKKLKDGNVEKAFSSSSDPTEQINLYKNFLEDYAKEIEEIRNIFADIQKSSNSPVDESLKNTKRLFKLTKTNTQTIKELRLNDYKQDIALKVKNLIGEENEHDIYQYKKSIRELISSLKKLSYDENIILPKSLNRDLKLLETLLERKEFEKHSSNPLKWFMIFGFISMAIAIGVLIWQII